MDFFNRFRKPKKSANCVEEDIPVNRLIVGFRFTHNGCLYHPRIKIDYERLKEQILYPRHAISLNWDLVYSSVEHGLSKNAFHSCIKNFKPPFLFVIQDVNFNVFGAFLDEKVSMNRCFGGLDCFLFKMVHKSFFKKSDLDIPYLEYLKIGKSKENSQKDESNLLKNNEAVIKDSSNKSKSFFHKIFKSSSEKKHELKNNDILVCDGDKKIFLVDTKKGHKTANRSSGSILKSCDENGLTLYDTNNQESFNGNEKYFESFNGNKKDPRSVNDNKKYVESHNENKKYFESLKENNHRSISDNHGPINNNYRFINDNHRSINSNHRSINDNKNNRNMDFLENTQDLYPKFGLSDDRLDVNIFNKKIPTFCKDEFHLKNEKSGILKKIVENEINTHLDYKDTIETGTDASFMPHNLNHGNFQSLNRKVAVEKNTPTSRTYNKLDSSYESIENYVKDVDFNDESKFYANFDGTGIGPIIYYFHNEIVPFLNTRCYEKHQKIKNFSDTKNDSFTGKNIIDNHKWNFYYLTHYLRDISLKKHMRCFPDRNSHNIIEKGVNYSTENRYLYSSGQNCVSFSKKPCACCDYRDSNTCTPKALYKEIYFRDLVKEKNDKPNVLQIENINHTDVNSRKEVTSTENFYKNDYVSKKKGSSPNLHYQKTIQNRFDAINYVIRNKKELLSNVDSRKIISFDDSSCIINHTRHDLQKRPMSTPFEFFDYKNKLIYNNNYFTKKQCFSEINLNRHSFYKNQQSISFEREKMGFYDLKKPTLDFKNPMVSRHFFENSHMQDKSKNTKETNDFTFEEIEKMRYSLQNQDLDRRDPETNKKYLINSFRENTLHRKIIFAHKDSSDELEFENDREIHSKDNQQRKSNKLEPLSQRKREKSSISFATKKSFGTNKNVSNKKNTEDCLEKVKIGGKIVEIKNTLKNQNEIKEFSRQDDLAGLKPTRIIPLNEKAIENLRRESLSLIKNTNFQNIYFRELKSHEIDFIKSNYSSFFMFEVRGMLKTLRKPFCTKRFDDLIDILQEIPNKQDKSIDNLLINPKILSFLSKQEYKDPYTDEITKPLFATKKMIDCLYQWKDFEDDFLKLKIDEEIGLFFDCLALKTKQLHLLNKESENIKKMRIQEKNLLNNFNSPKRSETQLNIHYSNISTSGSDYDEISDLEHNMKQLSLNQSLQTGKAADLDFLLNSNEAKSLSGIIEQYTKDYLRRVRDVSAIRNPKLNQTDDVLIKELKRHLITKFGIINDRTLLLSSLGLTGKDILDSEMLSVDQKFEIFDKFSNGKIFKNYFLMFMANYCRKADTENREETKIPTRYVKYSKDDFVTEGGYLNEYIDLSADTIYFCDEKYLDFNEKNFYDVKEGKNDSNKQTQDEQSSHLTDLFAQNDKDSQNTGQLKTPPFEYNNLGKYNTDSFFFKKFKATGKNKNFCTCNKDFLAFGCSNGKFGLLLDSFFSKGETYSVETYDNEVLTAGNKYDVRKIEIWSIII